MYWRLAYVPGGQPIGALETGFAKISRAVMKLFAARQPRIAFAAGTTGVGASEIIDAA
jgi:lipopolysaccharide export system permease protein